MSVSTESVLALAGFIGIGVFAASGALAAAEKRLDILGFILFGVVTGIGGGTIRDLILGVEVFWVSDGLDLQICIGASILSYFAAPYFIARLKVLTWLDAMGLALFSVIGTAKAHSLGAPFVVSVTMGLLTTTCGSIIRDVLLDRVPILLGPEIYVTAALSGCISYLLLMQTELTTSLCLFLAMLIAFLVRASAIIWGLRLPKFSKF